MIRTTFLTHGRMLLTFCSMAKRSEKEWKNESDAKWWTLVLLEIFSVWTMNPLPIYPLLCKNRDFSSANFWTSYENYLLAKSWSYLRQLFVVVYVHNCFSRYKYLWEIDGRRNNGQEKSFDAKNLLKQQQKVTC